jgi:endoglucanase
MINSGIPARSFMVGTAVAIGIGFSAAPMIYSEEAAPATVSAVPFGVYDPEKRFGDTAGIAIEHVFMPWENVDLSTLDAAGDYAAARGRALLVTVEPWSWGHGADPDGKALRADIFAGRHDATMRRACAAIGRQTPEVTIRWGHEMDKRNGQFIWSRWPHRDFISAFRRMASICRTEAPRARIMWSPIGEPGSERYYPGAEWVDVVGLSVFGLEPWEEARFGKALSFDEIFGPRYARAAAFGKPVIIAELGYSGSPDYVAAWDRDVAAAGRDRFPLLEGIIRFNARDVHDWPDGFGRPDWRMGRAVLP